MKDLEKVFKLSKTQEQLLRNPDIAPTAEVIAQTLGEANNAYIKFIDELARLDIRVEWHYYSDVKSWLARGIYAWIGPRGGKKEKTVFWMSVWNGSFKVTFYFPDSARADALNLPLDDETKEMIASARKMAKIKIFPLTFDLRLEDQLEAVILLAGLRKGIK